MSFAILLDDLFAADAVQCCTLSVQALSQASYSSTSNKVKQHKMKLSTCQLKIRLHSLGLIAMRALATADTPQMKPTGNSKGPASLVPKRGRKIPT